MSILALLLLLTAAILHTTWNLLLKNSDDKYIAIWWMVFNGGVISLIALFFTGLPPREAWTFIFFSVLVEAAYFITLSYAYQDNDFSLVYPIARGAAPAFLAAWSVIFLHETLTGGGLIGLFMIVIGLVVIGFSNLLEAKTAKLHIRGLAVAVFIALLISIYTVIDGAAVKQVPPVPYVLTIFCLAPIPMIPFIFKKYGWDRLKQPWQTQGLSLLLPGVLGITTYLLVTFAYRIAPLSYSGAVREVSVVMGAFAGWHFFGEKMGSVRLIGAFIIFAGILMVAIFG